MTGAWVGEWDEAHRHAVAAATAGLGDPALGASRLTGPGVPALAEAAVTSATPYLRAPLLARLQAAADLHLPEPDPEDLSGPGARAVPGPGAQASRPCPTCGTAYPCETVRRLQH